MQINRGPKDKVRRYTNPVEQVNRKLQPDATGEMVCLPLALVNVEGLGEPSSDLALLDVNRRRSQPLQ